MQRCSASCPTHAAGGEGLKDTHAGGDLKLLCSSSCCSLGFLCVAGDEGLRFQASISTAKQGLVVGEALSPRGLLCPSQQRELGAAG